MRLIVGLLLAVVIGMAGCGGGGGDSGGKTGKMVISSGTSTGTSVDTNGNPIPGGDSYSGSEVYTYDAFGNKTQTVGVGNLVSGGLPHINTFITNNESFDSHGNVNKSSTIIQGGSEFTSTYNYNYSADGSYTCVMVNFPLYSYGRGSGGGEPYPDTVTTYYDAKGNPIKTVTSDVFSITTDITKYEYDSNGKILSSTETSTSSTGVISTKNTQNTLDVNGNIVKSVETLIGYNFDGTIDAMFITIKLYVWKSV